jgi:hypothetical protein
VNVATNDPTLVSQGAAGLKPPLPLPERQDYQLSTATQNDFSGSLFKGITLNPVSDLSFDYESFGPQRRNQAGGVAPVANGRGQIMMLAAVNSDAIPEQARLYGLTPGSIDSKGQSQAGTLLNAVAAEEVAQKIVNTHPLLQGIGPQKEEVIGEAAMLNAMPETYTRTMMRTSQVLTGVITGTDYNGIAGQTTESMQKTLNAQGYTNLNAKDILKGMDAYVQRQSDSTTPSTPYAAAFQDYFKSVGIKDVGAFQQALQTTMQQDFDTTSRKMISEQVQSNTRAQNQPHTQSSDATHSAAPDHDPKFAHLLEQARDGLQTIGPVRLGVQGQAAIDNTAGVMANDALSKKFDDFARITQNDNGMVFGMKQDPDKHPGPYDYVAVNPKLAADVPLAQSANSAQEHAGKNQQTSLTQEPRGMSMG